MALFNNNEFGLQTSDFLRPNPNPGNRLLDQSFRPTGPSTLPPELMGLLGGQISNNGARGADRLSIAPQETFTVPQLPPELLALMDQQGTSPGQSVVSGPGTAINSFGIRPDHFSNEANPSLFSILSLLGQQPGNLTSRQQLGGFGGLGQQGGAIPRFF